MSDTSGWVELYNGLAPVVGMLEELLRQQGVQAMVLPVDPMTRLEGSVAWPAHLQRLLVTQADLEAHRAAIEEALSVVTAPPDGEDAAEPPSEA